MGRRLPVCAVCGEPLKGGAQVRLMYEALDGKPEVGWHPHCLGRNEWYKDAFFRDLREDSDSPEALAKLRRMLEEIKLRGPGRLVVNKVKP